jgi:mannose-6-phosphate isomerase-like protein (cupin superfamily)
VPSVRFLHSLTFCQCKFSVLARRSYVTYSSTAIMRKVNTINMQELSWSSPKGKFVGAGKQVSEELGRKPQSMELNERHPFDIEICRVPPGKTPYPYHSHSAQWEFYHVIAGSGEVRHKDGTTPVETGDAFIFKPGEPHQITNTTRKIWSFMWWRTIRLARRTIGRIATNGVCQYRNAESFVPMRWIISMARSEAVAR